MPQQHQPRVVVRLVLRPAHKPEGCQRSPSPAHYHPERVEQDAVSDGLSGVGNPPRAAKRVLVSELRGRSSPLRESRRVGGSPVLQNRACRLRAIADIGERSRRIVLADPQTKPVVGETVSRRTRIGDSRDAVFIVIRERRRGSSRNDGLAVPVRVISVLLKETPILNTSIQSGFSSRNSL